MYRIRNFKVDINDDSDILKLISKRVNIAISDIIFYKVVKKAIDFSDRENLSFLYTINFELKNEKRYYHLEKKQIINKIKIKKREKINLVNQDLSFKPIVVGMGPAGLFAAYTLAKYGIPPLIFEMGKKVEDRIIDVKKYWKSGILNENSNVQFGEGGAGTFSDGKLTTRLNEPRLDEILDLMVKLGAPNTILDGGKAHVGTDKLYIMLINFRNLLIKMGCEIFFQSEVKEFIQNDKILRGVIVNGEKIECQNLILATGNGSYNTYNTLLKNGVKITPKSFGIGIRIEHRRKFIDNIKFGKLMNHPKLGAADYSLFYNIPRTNRSVYSFCMCPGGIVVASASENGRIITNGMSYFKRDGINSNSALLVNVTPLDYMIDDNPLSGFLFQKKWEEIAFKLGGKDGKAPAQSVVNFLKDRDGGDISIASYKPGVVENNLRKALPEFVTNGLITALPKFDEIMNGFIKNGILTGVETRSSSPIKINRGEDFQSVSMKGLYPCGEGSGYAGGIICSAIDGIKAAEAMVKKYNKKREEI